MGRINQPVNVQWDTVPGISQYQIRVQVRSIGKVFNSEWSEHAYGDSKWTHADVDEINAPRNITLLVNNGN